MVYIACSSCLQGRTKIMLRKRTSYNSQYLLQQVSREDPNHLQEITLVPPSILKRCASLRLFICHCLCQMHLKCHLCISPFTELPPAGHQASPLGYAGVRVEVRRGLDGAHTPPRGPILGGGPTIYRLNENICAGKLQ